MKTRTQGISRRQMLKLSAAAAGGTILSAYGSPGKAAAAGVTQLSLAQIYAFRAYQVLRQHVWVLPLGKLF